METGFNVARNGGISYTRLDNLKQRMSFMMRGLEKMYLKERVIDLTDREIVDFFNAMRNGTLLTKDGKQYTSIPDYVNVFKAFWHWYQRVEEEKDDMKRPRSNPGAGDLQS